MVWFFLAGLALALAWLQVSINRETVSDLEILNPTGAAGTALIVYHPGLSKLQNELTSAFAMGLTDQGWRVERTTTSPAAPSDLAVYDLLVLGVHTYWWSPDDPTVRYLRRVGDLQAKPTVALLSALGATGRAERLTRARIEAVNGSVVDVQPFWVLRPNDESDPRPSPDVALDMAYRQALAVAGGLR